MISCVYNLWPNDDSQTLDIFLIHSYNRALPIVQWCRPPVVGGRTVSLGGSAETLKKPSVPQATLENLLRVFSTIPFVDIVRVPLKPSSLRDCSTSHSFSLHLCLYHMDWLGTFANRQVCKLFLMQTGMRFMEIGYLGYYTSIPVSIWVQRSVIQYESTWVNMFSSESKVITGYGHAILDLMITPAPSIAAAW